MRKGSIVYSVPVFKFYKSLDNESAKKADAAYDKMESYMNKYVNSKDTQIANIEVKSDLSAHAGEIKTTNLENLPF